MKTLNDILKSRPAENSDAELEGLLEEVNQLEEESTNGNCVLTMALLSNIIEMCDNVYNTITELETIDESTEQTVASLFELSEKFYKSFDKKYLISEVTLNYDQEIN